MIVQIFSQILPTLIFLCDFIQDALSSLNVINIKMCIYIIFPVLASETVWSQYIITRIVLFNQFKSSEKRLCCLWFFNQDTGRYNLISQCKEFANPSGTVAFSQTSIVLTLFYSFHKEHRIFFLEYFTLVLLCYHICFSPGKYFFNIHIVLHIVFIFRFLMLCTNFMSSFFMLEYALLQLLEHFSLPSLSITLVYVCCCMILRSVLQMWLDVRSVLTKANEKMYTD